MKRSDQLQDDLDCPRRKELRLILLIRAKDLQRCSDVFMNTPAYKIAKAVETIMNKFKYTI